MPKKPLWKNRQLRNTLIALVLVVITLSLVAYFAWPFLSQFDSLEQVRETIAGAGPWSPVVFVTAQVLQVVFAPIPGQVTGFVGGLLFGTLWGTFFSMIGTTIGFAIVFTLARKLGRPFVEYFVSSEDLKKFDYLSETKGIWIVFLIFLLPAMPDAVAGYAVGLTAIRIRVLILLSVLGRLPGIYLLSLAGAETANANFLLVGGMIVASIVLVGAAYLWRNRIDKFLRRFSGDEKK